MSPKEKYDNVISFIEKNADDRYLRADELASKVAASCALSLREMTTLISFMTGLTLLQYIKGRKMMAAYKHIIQPEHPKYNKSIIAAAIEIADLGSHQAFDKKFSSCFGQSPTDAFKRKDASLITEPLFWDVLSRKSTEPDRQDEEAKWMPDKMKFGVLQEQYEKIIQAAELTALYSLETVFSDYAFELSETGISSLDEAFRFAGSIREFFSYKYDESDDSDASDMAQLPKEIIHSIGDDKCFQFMFFTCKIEVADASYILDYIPLEKEEIIKLDPMLLILFCKYFEEDYDGEPNYEFMVFKEAYEYYTAQVDSDYQVEDFDEYIEYLDSGLSIEEAFSWTKKSHLKYSLASLPYYDIFRKMEEEYSAIDEWADQEMDYSEERFDIDIDSDNLGYVDDDSGPFDF